jgi:hypothetical protein
LTYTCASGIVWTKERDHVLVVAPESGQWWALDGTETPIWEWLCLGYPHHKLVALLADVLSLTGEAAAALLADTLRRWLEDHLVEEQHD